MKLKSFYIAILSALAFCIPSKAQTDTVVSLITAFPGSDIYELEGHSAIRVNFGDGRDFAISYGLFNFNSPNFVYRFVKGETDYMVGALPFNHFIDEYRRQGRRVEELPLNLTAAEKLRLIELIENNLLPENRVYRYNYVKDNCATRPLRMIELAVGDTLSLAPARIELPYSPASFRDVMRFYHRNYPWYQFGIDLALGAGIDYPLNNREYSFVPMLLAREVQGATLGGRKIADSPIVVSDFEPNNAVMAATPWFLTPLCVFWILFVIISIVVICDLIHCRITRWIDAVFFGALGLTGLLLTFLIFVSVHEATSPNWLYLWINPLCLIPTIFIWLKKCNIVVFCYQFVNFAVVFISLAAWPFISQSANAAFLPLVLADLALSGRYLWVNYKRVYSNRNRNEAL